MFFYELHEGDNEVFSDVIVVSESEWEPEEFFELVQSIRRRIQDTFAHDTLSESIAVELEREHGFIYVSDDSLVASVNVSTDESENFLVRTDGRAGRRRGETTMMMMTTRTKTSTTRRSSSTSTRAAA